MTDVLVPPPVEDRDAPPPATADEIVAHRRRVRRRLWLWSSPAVLVVLLVAAKLLSLPLFAALSQWAYAERRYELAADLTAPLGVVDVVEPWVGHFDRGAALAQVGVLESARQELTTALDLVPDDDRVSCVVRVDLVLVIEAQGDAAVTDLRFADAQALYEQGRQVVDEAPEGCFLPPEEPDEPDTGQPLDDAGDRLDEKGEQAQGQQGDEPGPGGDDGDQGGGADQGDDGEGGGQDPLDRLREQGEQGAEEQQQRDDRERYEQRDPDDYDGRPW